MHNFFGKNANAWARGPPGHDEGDPGGGPRSDSGSGPGAGPGPGPGPGRAGAGPRDGGGEQLNGAVRNAYEHAKALMYKRKKKEENRSYYQENLKRVAVKEEKNYLIFQIREGVGHVPFNDIGKMLDNLEITAADVVSIAGNPYNPNEFEILLKEEKNVNIATLNMKLDDIGAPVTVNKMGKMEEIFIIRNLPLTLNESLVRKWIKEAVSPFVEKVHDITPLKHTKRQLGDVGEVALKFFEGKFDGNWRVSVSPKGTAEVPSFVAVGPENLQGTVKYSKRVQPINELCWSCYVPGHKRSDKDGEGRMVCSGPKDWKEYVKEFQDNAVNVSGKPTEELFSFNDTGPIIAKYEAEIADYVDRLEKENEEKQNREAALKKVKEALEDNNEKWEKIVKERNQQLKNQKRECEENLEKEKKDERAIKKLTEEIEMLRENLKDSNLVNKNLQEEIENLTTENNEILEKTLEDAVMIADANMENAGLDFVNTTLLNIVERNSAAEEEVAVEETQDESVDTVKDNQSEDDQMDQEVSEADRIIDDPILTNEDVFEENEMEAEKTVESSEAKKHGLSPESVGQGPPDGKQIMRSNSLDPTKNRSDRKESLSDYPPPIFPPPPPPPPPPPFLPPPPLVKRKSILRVSKGMIVEIFDEEAGPIKAKILSRQVKTGSKDFKQYKDCFNVLIIEGNTNYPTGTEMGFDLSNPMSFSFVRSVRQSSTSETE